MQPKPIDALGNEIEVGFSYDDGNDICVVKYILDDCIVYEDFIKQVITYEDAKVNWYPEGMRPAIDESYRIAIDFEQFTQFIELIRNLFKAKIETPEPQKLSYGHELILILQNLMSDHDNLIMAYIQNSFKETFINQQTFSIDNDKMKLAKLYAKLTSN